MIESEFMRKLKEAREFIYRDIKKAFDFYIK